MNHETTTPITDAVADFIADCTVENLPSSVLERIHTLVLDGTGALIAAANPRFSTGTLISVLARDQGGTPESSVVGQGFKTGCLQAALANGTMGYACDVEPHHPEGILHPVSVMIPTALAAGERAKTDGKRFLAAVALGCEITYRLSMALSPREQYGLGFHPSAVCGCFGAAAAAASIFGLDAEAVGRTLGLAACQASGMMAWESDPTENARPFQMGVAARNGITAALLAQQGFGGPVGIFDHGHTPFRAFSRSPDPDRLIDNLGDCWDGVMELAIKPYSCVAFLHPALDALLGLMQDEQITAADIIKITMHFPRSGIHCINNNPLKSHCAQYILPVAAVRGGLQVEDIFFDRRLEDPAVATLSERVVVMADEGELEDLFPDFYATVIEVETADGRRFTRRNDIARGYPEQPMTQEEIERKFAALVGTVATTERIRVLRAAIADLPNADDLGAYADPLRAPVDLTFA